MQGLASWVIEQLHASWTGENHQKNFSRETTTNGDIPAIPKFPTAINIPAVSESTTSQAYPAESRDMVHPHISLRYHEANEEYSQILVSTMNLLELPTELLLHIIGFVVVISGQGTWVAFGIDQDSQRSSQSHSLSGIAYPRHNEVSQAPHGGLTIVRNPISDATKSLLLTSREVRTLTLRVLMSHFSGNLRLRDNSQTPQCRDAWSTLNPASIFVTQNELLFSNVEQLEIHYSCEVWPELSTIMPKLKRVRFSASQDVWCRLAGSATLSKYELVDEDDDAYNADGVYQLYHGVYDEAIIATGNASVAKWIEWCTLVDKPGSGTPRNLEMLVVVRLGAAWHHPWVQWVSTPIPSPLATLHAKDVISQSPANTLR